MTNLYILYKYLPDQATHLVRQLDLELENLPTTLKPGMCIYLAAGGVQKPNYPVN